MYCPNCGNGLEDDSVFCSKCGASTDTSPAPDRTVSAMKGKHSRFVPIVVIAIVAICVVVGAVFAVPRLLIQPSIEGVWSLTGSVTTGGITANYPVVRLDIGEDDFDLNVSGQMDGGIRLFGLASGDPIDMTINGSYEKIGETDSSLTYALNFDGISCSDSMMDSLRSMYGMTDTQENSIMTELTEVSNSMNRASVQIVVPKSGIDDSFADGEWSLSFLVNPNEGESFRGAMSLVFDPNTHQVVLKEVSSESELEYGTTTWSIDDAGELVIDVPLSFSDTAASSQIKIGFDPA